jgi:hypothetical protein
MSAHVLPPLAVNSKSEQKVNSLPPLRFEPVIFGMLEHLSNHSAKSHPNIMVIFIMVVVISFSDDGGNGGGLGGDRRVGPDGV